MNCRYVENNLIGYIENILTAQEMQQIGNHLQKCKGCQSLISKVSDTYTVLQHDKAPTPDLFLKIQAKLQNRNVSVIEFIPQHRAIFRIAASVVILVGIAIGVLIGGKYATSDNGKVTANTVQGDANYFFNTASYDMDNEPDLAVLYPNE